ncbi:MAG: PspC domain-containing protein [Acidobacteriaceae bacterium]|jgi:phage shock protein C
MNCAACGKELSFGSRFCSNCGHAVPPPPVAPPAQPYAPYQRIVRPHYGRMIGGVCAGIAQHCGWDVALVRILLVVLVFFGCGTPILAYFIAWIVIPNEPYSFPTDPYAQTYAQPYAPPTPQPAAPTNGPTA